jgi:hypothetical protein
VELRDKLLAGLKRAVDQYTDDAAKS